MQPFPDLVRNIMPTMRRCHIRHPTHFHSPQQFTIISLDHFKSSTSGNSHPHRRSVSCLGHGFKSRPGRQPIECSSNNLLKPTVEVMGGWVRPPDLISPLWANGRPNRSTGGFLRWTGCPGGLKGFTCFENRGYGKYGAKYRTIQLSSEHESPLIRQSRGQGKNPRERTGIGKRSATGPTNNPHRMEGVSIRGARSRSNSGGTLLHWLGG